LQISIKDYNLQNIIFVHNFILIILIFVLLLVSLCLIYVIIIFNDKDMQKEWHHLWKVCYNCLFMYMPLEVYFFHLNRRYKINAFATHNINLEIIWTIVPIFFILEIIFPSLSLIADDEIDHKGSIYTVGVIGNQWYWNYELNLAIGVIKYVSNLFIIDDSVAEHKKLNRLLSTTKSLPIVVGNKTSFFITSNDVAHSWSLPGLGLKVDAIPGRINLKTVLVTRLGLYSGMCSELCGVEHGFMPISVKVMSFTDWWYNIKDLLEDVNLKKNFYLNDVWYLIK